MFRTELMVRLKSGWESYRVLALGSGLPFLFWAVMVLVIECGRLDPMAGAGLWIGGTFVFCQVEAWAFHSVRCAKGGTVLSSKERPVGFFWAFYSLIGVGLQCALVQNESEMLVVIRAQGCLSVFLMQIALVDFVMTAWRPQKAVVS